MVPKSAKDTRKGRAQPLRAGRDGAFTAARRQSRQEKKETRRDGLRAHGPRNLRISTIIMHSLTCSLSIPCAILLAFGLGRKRKRKRKRKRAECNILQKRLPLRVTYTPRLYGGRSGAFSMEGHSEKVTLGGPFDPRLYECKATAGRFAPSGKSRNEFVCRRLVDSAASSRAAAFVELLGAFCFLRGFNQG
ncbi:hypothetical protein SUGI_0430760 [Cryptomeria japonica]|nr:hypothetical protein SUGI_0430760 [Cryptomeria japonica]